MAQQPEADLLLCCARTHLSSEKKEEIGALLHSEIDWPYLIRIADAHGLMPLLYFNLKKAFPDSVPRSVLDQLHARFLANAGRNLFLTQELFKILDLCEMNAIPAIPFKGPALAISLYGDLALRTFSDLDILVRKQDIQRAKTLLLSQGYRLDLSLTKQQEIVFLHSDLEGGFVRQDGRVRVEVHWGEPKDFPLTLDLEPFWKRLRKFFF